MDEAESSKPQPTVSTTEEKPPRRARRSESPSSSSAPELPVGQLISAASELLGVSPWVAAGALHDHDRAEMMNAKTALAEIERWRKRPVGGE